METARDGRRPEQTVYAATETGQAEFVRWIDELIRTPVAEYLRARRGLAEPPSD